MSQQTKFDGVLMSIIQQQGNINGFFDSVFGFLRRNTDFFSNQQKAQQIIVGTCKKNFDKFTADQAQKKKQQIRKKQAQQKRKKLKQEQSKKQQQKPKVIQVKPVAKVQQQKQTSQKKQGQDKPLPGNGGRNSLYIWTQTLQSLQLYIFLDSSITKNQVKVNITVDSIKVVIAGNTIIDGKWKQKINAQDTLWLIDTGVIQDYNGKYLNISVQKWKNQTSWWNTPIQGHQQIDTQKINPQPSKLSDLDGQTRSTVQKMMFDMKQKQAGLPSSDQLLKQQKLKQFMKAHPQMDFSQCKFN